MPIPHGTPGGYTNHRCRCDDCREAVYAYQRAYYARRKAADPSFKRRSRIVGRKRRIEMSEAQAGCCAICGTPEGDRALHVDHDHKTGVVRELLCQNCNCGLGFFGESVERLTRAIAYLEKHRCQ